MNRSPYVGALGSTDDLLLELISLHSVDELPVHGQESDTGAPSNHATCTGSSDAGQVRSQNIFQRPWSARLRSYRQSRKNAWRTVLTFNILMTLAIFLFNASFFLIAAKHHDSTEGSLYSGSCPKIKTFAMLGHIVINIFGTLLLSASNYTMQILASPSRDDIDRAHRLGIPLSIGVQSLRNLKFVGYTRMTLWIALAIASIPLHLLYNSTVFKTTRQSAYVVGVVTPNFQEGAPFDLQFTNEFTANAPIPTPEVWTNEVRRDYFSQKPHAFYDFLGESGYELPQIRAKDEDVLLRLQRKAQNLELMNISSTECLEMYLNSPPVNYRHVLTVSNYTTSNNSILWFDSLSSSNKSSKDWMHAYKNVNGEIKPSDVWILGLYAKHNDTGWWLNGYRISGCLVEQVEDPCSLRYNSSLLIIVLIANVVKLVAMSATIFQYRQPALVTVGDALASFLETPDCTTYQMCLTGKDEFDAYIWTTGPKTYYLANGEGFRYSTGAPQLQWVIAVALMICSFIAGAVCLILLYAKPETADLGQSLPETILICLANLPQLVLSFIYIQCNRLMTSMAGSREWSLFAHQRKGLRTSQPRGSQRSTYWLQLPMKLSLPVMGVSSLLHYVTSQCIYFGSTKFYDYPGKADKPVVLEDKSVLGYSSIAIHVLLILLVLAFGAMAMWGQRNIQLGIPPCGFNSAIISAACHPPIEEEEPHLKPVQWGAVPNDGDQDDIGHCSFSSGGVTMPLEGKMYM